MGLEGRKYMLVNGIDQLGKFYLHYGSAYDHPKKSCLRPVFAIKNEKQNNFTLEPGYLSTDNNFYPCPFSIFHVQLNFIKSYRKDDNEHIEAHLQIFSKDFIFKKEIQVHLYSFWLGSGVVGPMNINEIVNSINNYIDSDNELELLNEELFKSQFQIRELKNNQILMDINKLTFKYYSNDRSRVGKDNRFWNEVEIQNLPDNEYLIRLYMELIRKSGIVDSIEISNNMLFATYGIDYAHSPSHGRQEMKEDIGKSNEIKDMLKYSINEAIDLVKEKNERMKKADKTVFSK